MKTVIGRAALVCAALFATSLVAEDKRIVPTDQVKTWIGGDRVVSILQKADRVECFRVNPEKPTEPMGKECGGYPVVDTAKEQKVEFARDLGNILLDEKTYDFKRAKRCEFAPGVGYRLWTDKEHVEVVICFTCDELEIHWQVPDAKAPTPPHLAREDCDAARAALVKLAKTAFPEDKEIQGLADKHK